jgi:hypothetical protein
MAGLKTHPASREIAVTGMGRRFTKLITIKISALKIHVYARTYPSLGKAYSNCVVRSSDVASRKPSAGQTKKAPFAQFRRSKQRGLNRRAAVPSQTRASREMPITENTTWGDNSS